MRTADALGFICLLASITLQILICFVKMSGDKKEELADGARLAATAGLIFEGFAWAFSVLTGEVYDMASEMIVAGAFYGGMFLIWLFSGLRKNVSFREKGIGNRLRGNCVWYAVIAFAMGFLFG